VYIRIGDGGACACVCVCVHALVFTFTSSLRKVYYTIYVSKASMKIISTGTVETIENTLILVAVTNNFMHHLYTLTSCASDGSCWQD